MYIAGRYSKTKCTGARKVFEIKILKATIATMLVAAAAAGFCLPILAGGPPVRISVVTGGQSGIEQDIVDKISVQLEQNPDVAISTVNPDWQVVCTIKENMDQYSGQIRYNGDVVVKTMKGQVITTVAVQQYKQDFSVTPGAPLNKALVDRAAREATSGAAARAIPRIEQAVQTEMDTRGKIITAQIQAEQKQYDAAINTLRLVSPDSPHFQNARDLMNEFETKKAALAKGARAASAAKAKKKATLTSSKPKTKALVKDNKPGGTSGDAELKALDKVLKIEKQAIEDAQAKVRSKLNTK